MKASRRLRRALFAAASCAASSAGAPLSAQDTTAAALADSADARASRASCEGAVVAEVEIRRQPPRISRSAPRWSRPLLRVLFQQATTEPSAIRPFFLFEERGRCEPFRLEESERVLRAQPYLADAVVRAVPAAPGDSVRPGAVRVEVETVDEIPLVIGARLRGGELAGLKYGSANAFGKGIYAAGEWRRGFAYRDGFAARVVHYHVLGRPIRLSGEADRAPLGHDYSAALERPFYTAFQHVGWHAGARNVSEFVSFLRPEGPRLSLPYARTRADAGGVIRLGPGGGILFAGPFVTYERAEPRGDPVVVTDTGLVDDPDPTLLGRYETFERTTLAGVLGARLLSFLRVEGFDALAGPQDVARGVQAAGAVGRSAGTGRDATALAADVYAGAGGTRSFLALRGQWEGRREPGQWANLVASGRVAWYWKPADRRTLILGAEYSGAWRQRRPFQLALGDRGGGLRGYDESRVVGARRAVLRAEHRWVVGGISDWLGLGVAGFADAGKVWAGAVPYGQTTGLRASVGAGLLAAVPRQSRRTVRLDVAVPVVKDPHAGYEVRVTTTRPIRGLWREPADIQRVRAILPPAGIFAWP
ncbi:MAG TPA: hypothetical protein VNA89_08005 [Gemmatimonadaceae bacterium]|nr:hypothetical protein [Gemmatimonadaceae bacterium]